MQMVGNGLPRRQLMTCLNEHNQLPQRFRRGSPAAPEPIIVPGRGEQESAPTAPLTRKGF